MGGGQNLKQLNIEWAIFQNSKIANIKITNDEFCDSFILNFFLFLYLFKLCQYEKMIIYRLKISWNFNSFPNCEFFKICYFSK